MAYDPFYSTSPSDSGLLEGIDANFAAGPTPRGPGAVPSRDEYVAPEPAGVDADSPEESLREAPLPDGFLTRLRRFVDDL